MTRRQRLPTPIGCLHHSRLGPLPWALSIFSVTLIILLVIAQPYPASAQFSLGPGIITVDRVDDIATASACTGAADDCSLRGAVIFANANPGTTIIVPSGTYRLTIDGNVERGFCADAAVGDLDIAGDNTTIIGAGPATTMIQQTTPNDRVICVDQNLVGNFTFSISGLTVSGGRETHGVGGGGMIAGLAGDVTNVTNVTFADNQASGPGSPMGGGLANVAGALNVVDSSFVNNQSTGSGGGLYYSGNKSSGPPTLKVVNSTFRNNVTTGGNGGAIKVTSAAEPYMISNSTFAGNEARGAGSIGGAIVNESGRLNIDHSDFAGNQVTASGGRGGALGSVDGGSQSITVEASRFVGNRAAEPTNGGAVYTGYGATTMAVNNWWGCNGGPGTPGCDTVANGASHPRFAGGVTTFAPWIVLSNSASRNTVTVGESTTLSASFLQNSSNQLLSESQVSALVRLPVLFGNVVNGSLSAPRSNIQSNGSATTTFTAGGAGIGSVDAMVDMATATTAITAIRASTTTTLAAEDSSQAVVGQPMVINYVVAGGNTGLGAPTGDVTVTDGTNSCTGTVADGRCTLTFASQGDKRLTASYGGDANFDGSQSSSSDLRVQKADTTTVLATGDTWPSVGEPAAVRFAVLVNAPGAGAPGGDVTVTDGTTSCTASAAVGECSLTFTSTGTRNLIATYTGDSSFNASTSDSEQYRVGPPATTSRVTALEPASSVVGQVVTVSYRVSSNARADAPAGNVIVSDGSNSCTSSAASGQCNMTFTAAGTRSITATYVGNADFAGSSSAAASHEVDRARTATTITSNSTAPSIVGQGVTAKYRVSVNSPGAGQPTGTVTVTDGIDSCTGSIEAGQCTIALTTVGSRTLTATYNGDANFEGSASAGSPQMVRLPNTAPTAKVSGGQCAAGSSAGGTLNLTLSDAEGDPISVSVASNTNASLVPNRSIVIGGTGTRRTLQITPATRRSGTAVITLSLSDGNLTSPFIVTVMVAQDDRSTTLNGTDNTDVIFGRAGRDTIRGYDGDDLLCGGAGNDTISGGSGNDIIDGGDGDDTLRGDDGNDILRGGRGDDLVDGGDGDDTLLDNSDSARTQRRPDD